MAVGNVVCLGYRKDSKGRVIKVPLMISPDVDAIQKLLPSTCRKWVDVILKKFSIYISMKIMFGI